MHGCFLSSQSSSFHQECTPKVSPRQRPGAQGQTYPSPPQKMTYSSGRNPSQRRLTNTAAPTHKPTGWKSTRFQKQKDDIFGMSSKTRFALSSEGKPAKPLLGQTYPPHKKAVIEESKNLSQRWQELFCPQKKRQVAQSGKDPERSGALPFTSNRAKNQRTYLRDGRN